MAKPINVTALLSSAAMVARKAETYSADTHVIELADLRRIVFELQEGDQDASIRTT